MANIKHPKIITNKELMAEWDWEANEAEGINPDNLTLGSYKEANWIGPCGHKWKTLVSSKWKSNGCPICSGRKVLEGYNDLASQRQDLMIEWDYKENDKVGLNPTKLTCHSNRKAHWICKLGHKWVTSIAHRADGTGCPCCSNEKVWPGYNDLATKYPNLLEEWNWKLNNTEDLYPDKILYGSSKKAWWTCKECGYVWKAEIRSRTEGKDCIKCAPKKISIKLSVPKKGHSLAEKRPDLALEWDNESNGELTPDKIAYSSTKKVWWKCCSGHKYQATVGNRTNKGCGCPICAKETRTSLPEQTVFYYIKQYFPDAINGYKDLESGITELDIYIPSLKVAIEYDGYHWHNKNTKGKENRKQIACKKKCIKLYRIKEYAYKKEIKRIRDTYYHKHNNADNLEKILIELLAELNIFNPDINISRDISKIYSQYVYSKKENSLSSKHPEILYEWNFDKNGDLTPDMFNHGSNKKVWWVCKYGHEWQTKISDRAKGRGCPYCAGNIFLEGFNDLSTKYPKIAKCWSENNTLKPTKIRPSSKEKIKLICEHCNNEFTRECCKTVTIYKKRNRILCEPCSRKMQGITLTQRTLLLKSNIKELYPDIVKQWAEDNEIAPDKITAGSSRHVSLICKECNQAFSREMSKHVKSFNIQQKVICCCCAKKKPKTKKLDN